MFIRIVFISMMLAFAASAQAPAQTDAPLSSQEVLNESLDMTDAGANTPTQTEFRQASPWRALFSLILVLGIAGGGIWALRKYGLKRLPGSGGNRMKVEETLALGERRFVSILKVDDERFLVATHPHGISLLGRLDGGVEPGFGQELEQQMQIQAPISIRDMETSFKGDQQ